MTARQRTYYKIKMRQTGKNKVGIVMGSDSDLPLMGKAAEVLETLEIPYEMHIISAHREADIFFEWAKKAEENGFSVIIAGAGMAAHLPGMCAALFQLPVIGVPLSGKTLGGQDALYSILQMPPGVPVATMAIDGTKNAAIYAARIISVSDKELRSRLKKYLEDSSKEVMKKDSRLQEIGWRAYIENGN